MAIIGKSATGVSDEWSVSLAQNGCEKLIIDVSTGA